MDILKDICIQYMEAAQKKAERKNEEEDDASFT